MLRPWPDAPPSVSGPHFILDERSDATASQLLQRSLAGQKLSRGAKRPPQAIGRAVLSSTDPRNRNGAGWSAERIGSRAPRSRLFKIRNSGGSFLGAARGESLPAFAREASPKGDERCIPSGLLRSRARMFRAFRLIARRAPRSWPKDFLQRVKGNFRYRTRRAARSVTPATVIANDPTFRGE